MTGTGAVEWLMSYQEDGTARFVGLQQLDGEIEGRAGSVVLDTVGDFDGKEAAGVDRRSGSGTGAWAECAATGTTGRPSARRRASPLTTTSSQPLCPSRRASQAANLLGALGSAVTDRVKATVTGAAGGAKNDATALSALLHFLDDPRIDQLAEVLGLTSSGTVRLVDRLQRLGLVERCAGSDARATSIAVTPAGGPGRHVGRARTELLERALAAHHRRSVMSSECWPEDPRRHHAPRGEYGWMCRLCDTGRCGRPEGHCPVAHAATAAG